MSKKGVIFLSMILLLISFVLAQWNPDLDGDGCITDDDLFSVSTKYGATGTSDFDVNDDRIVDEKDGQIIQSYIDRGEGTGGCDGFKCIPEDCNSEDDDCDGIPDEDTDEEMCGGNLACRAGECVFLAGECYDTDGYDIYVQGNSIGDTDDDMAINQDESCYEVDIYGKLRDTTECYGKECFLIEYNCNEAGKLIPENINCEFGCKFGKCRKITKRCIETDEGLDIFEMSDGSFEDSSGNIIPLEDTCTDTDGDGSVDTLVEYECFGEFDTKTSILDEYYEKFEITCNCKDGICINVAKGECVDTDGNEKFIRGYTIGETAKGEPVSEFDYCMKKVGKDYNKIERCEGELCYLREFACSFAGEFLKNIHECPLGCIDGLCIGTECAKGEFFVLDEDAVLSYDNDCEYEQIKAVDQYDKPSEGFNNLRDFACCSGSSEAYCVYQKKCYPSSRTSNVYEFDGESVVCGCTDSTCSFSDGNHVGLWYDLDSSEDICEGGDSICNMRWYPKTGFRWIEPGIDKVQVENVWEYESAEAECCGDDSGEYVICEGLECICCDSEDMHYDNGKCAEGAREKGTDDIEIIETTSPDEKQTGETTGQQPVEAGEDSEESKVKSFLMKNIIFIIIVLVLVGVIVVLMLRRRETFIMEEEDDENNPDKESKKRKE